MVKGVLRPEDALRSVQAGAGAVWVSNHGGRQLDRAASTAACLPDVVAAVGERAEVYVDGGLRSGLDVLAALTLGADAVFFGRSPLLALVDGTAGGHPLARRAARADRRGAPPGRLPDPGRHARTRRAHRRRTASDLRKRCCGRGHVEPI